MDSSLVIQVDLDSTTPAYRQIVDQMRACLVSGQLRAGDPLPPVRRLAIDLAVHHNTVAQAYRQLAAEGWLDLRRRRGAVVTERTTPALSPVTERRFGQRLRELIAQAQAEGLGPDRLVQILEQLQHQVQENSL